MSVRRRLIVAFVFCTIAIVGLGGLAFQAAWSLGGLTQSLFDDLQAINHARSAQTSFASIEGARDETGSETWDIVVEDLLLDLDLVIELSEHAGVLPYVDQVRGDLGAWRAGDPEASARIAEALEIVVQLVAADGYRSWLGAESVIDETRQLILIVASVVIVAVLVLAVWLIRTIVGPLGRIQTATNAIAAGRPDVAFLSGSWG